jgi:hypothetical protein
MRLGRMPATDRLTAADLNLVEGLQNNRLTVF